MKILVLGGSGTVGRQVVRSLLEKGGADITATSRSGSGPNLGVRWVAADLEDPASLTAAFHGQDRMYLLTPLHPEETRLGLAAVAAAQAADVSRIVLHSVFRAERYPQIPHFASKVRILDAIRASGIPWTAIKPNSYFQNDLGVLDALRHAGVYPLPLGSKGISRVDARDIGDAGANALLEDGHEGTEVPLNGAQSLTGAQTAELWGRHLGREIAYAGDDVSAWQEAALAFLPPWMVEDLALMLQTFVEDGFVGTEEDMATQSHLLGHAPRTLEDFMAETVDG